MKRLFEQEQVKVKKILTIAVVTALSAITSISCSQNKDVLVTEIGLSPPNSRIAQTSAAGNLYVQGKNQHLRGDLQGAIATYTRVIEMDSSFAPAYKSRGLAYFDAGDKQRAIADYNQALNLSPDDAEAYNNRGNALASLGDHQRAIADYDEAIRLSPRYAEAYNNRGNARAALGDNNEAINDFNQAISLDPRYAIAYNNRGNARAAEGDRQGARQDLQRAASIFQSQNNNDLYKQVMNNIRELGQQ